MIFKRRKILALGVKSYLNKGVLNRYEKIFEIDFSSQIEKSKILILFLDEFFNQ